jgi:hypothetical protein
VDAKTITYFVLAGITITGAIVAFAKQFSKIEELGRGQSKIMKLLYPEDGKARFQTVDGCKECRHECRDDICAYVSKELARLEGSFIRFHTRLDGFDDDMKDIGKELQKIAIWMPEKK